MSKLPQLPPRNFGRAEFNRGHYQVLTEPETKAEHVLVPSYWAHICNRLKAGDIIEVKARDGSYHFEVAVIEVGILMARVRTYPYGKPETVSKEIREAASDAGDLKVEFCPGGGHKWRVLKGKDVIAKGYETQADAQTFANEYANKLAA